jgi:glycosyltransferase involved in cell wall biosynthesis
VPADRLFVVPTGVDLARFDPSAVDGGGIRRALGIPTAAPVVGTISVLRAIKGADVFLRGCRAILDRIPSARFLVVGDGPMRREVRELRDALGLSATVHLLGQREDVPELLAAMDVFVFPSLGADINSQAVSQAMAMGVAVVASDIPGNQEQARDGDTALVFPPGDAGALAEATCRLIGDEATRRRLAARGQATVRAGYTLETMLDRMESIYGVQIAKRRGQGTVSGVRASAPGAGRDS